MPIRVYVSPDPSAAFGDDWEQVDALDTAEPTVNTKPAQKLEALSFGGETRMEFHLAADPRSRWLSADAEHSSFGIALDLFGDGYRVLVAEGPAKVAQLTIRPPEPHPGLVVRPVMVPVKVIGTLNAA